MKEVLKKSLSALGLHKKTHEGELYVQINNEPSIKADEFDCSNIPGNVSLKRSKSDNHMNVDHDENGCETIAKVNASPFLAFKNDQRIHQRRLGLVEQNAKERKDLKHALKTHMVNENLKAYCFDDMLL